MPTENGNTAALAVKPAAKRKVLNLDEVMAAAERMDGTGFCTKCGQETSGVEPDARKYECEACGALAVYGAEELMLHCIG